MGQPQLNRWRPIYPSRRNFVFESEYAPRNSTTSLGVTMEGPSSFIFYVVARVEPHGQYYPLAVVSVQYDALEHFSGIQVVESCLSVCRILSSDDSRHAVEVEMLLAKTFYSPTGCPVKAERLEDRNDPLKVNYESKPIPLPFILTCLVLGVGYDAKFHIARHNIVGKPLGLQLDDDLDNLVLVVINITDTLRPRHGILAHEAQDRPIHFDPPEFYEFVDYRGARTRKPMDAHEYMSKFYYGKREGIRARIAEAQRVWRPAPAAALNCMLMSSSLEDGS